MYCYTHCPNPAAGHHQPTPLLETPGYSRARLGQTLVESLLLFPVSCCVWVSVCALQVSYFPVLYKCWQLYGGVNGNLLQRGFMPYLGLLHPEPLPLWQATADLYLCRRHSNTALAQFLWGLWVLAHKVFWCPLSISGRYGN